LERKRQMKTPMPDGSHDDIDYKPGKYTSQILFNDGVAMRLGGIPVSLLTYWFEVLEYLANKGELDAANKEPSTKTGFDGLDELMNDALDFWAHHYDKEGDIEYG
jgi:hypothetical protein